MGLFSSKSSSATTNTSEAFEVGVSAQDQGTANFTRTEITGNGNTLTDFGAVSASLQLALRGVELANESAQQATQQATTLIGGTLSMQGDQQQQFTDAVEKIKTSDVRVLIVGALALLGIVAFTIARKT